MSVSNFSSETMRVDFQMIVKIGVEKNNNQVQGCRVPVLGTENGTCVLILKNGESITVSRKKLSKHV